MGKSGKAYTITRAALAGLGLVGLAVLTVELFAQLAIFTVDDVLNIGATEALAHQLAFEYVDYDAVQLYKEQEASEDKIYSPYVVWKHQPYDGKLMSVDEDANRVTEYNSSAEDAIEIWMFGGSALFGIGAPDAQTVPSHLSKLVNKEAGVNAHVRNFGQEGYVSTQELVALIRELQARERPDVVIFYDGFNDAISAQRWSEIPGSHFQPYRTGERLEKTLVPLIRSSSVIKMAEYLFGFDISPKTGQRVRVEPAVAGARSAELWLENEAIVSALGKQYEFEHLFVFQPMLGFPTGIAMRNAVRDAQTRGQAKNVYDLSDLLRKPDDPVFIDSVHLTGNGNEIVAKSVYDILKHEACRKSSSETTRFTSPKLDALCQ